MEKNIRRLQPMIGATVLAWLLVALAGCRSQPAKLEELHGPTMGTTYTVKYLPVAGSKPVNIARQVEEVLQEVNRQMSTYREDSEICRFNRSRQTGWFPVSDWFARVTEAALSISAFSHGAFDVTVAPLVDLWGFGPKEGIRTPPQEEIDRLRGLTGWRYLAVRTDPPALKKEIPALTCDLSAIAKGFAVDAVGELLAGQGVVNFMVEIGGEVLARGSRAEGADWRVGIETPDAPGNISRIVRLRDVALATSGDYRNYFEENGVRFSHTIDPRTGRPVRHRLASVSVLADSCMRADALATAVDVMGPEKGMAFAEREGLAVFMLVRDSSGGFEERMTKDFRRALLVADDTQPKMNGLARFAALFAASLLLFGLLALLFHWLLRKGRGRGCSCGGASQSSPCSRCTMPPSDTGNGSGTDPHRQT